MYPSLDLLGGGTLGVVVQPVLRMGGGLAKSGAKLLAHAGGLLLGGLVDLVDGGLDGVAGFGLREHKTKSRNGQEANHRNKVSR